MKLIKTRHDSLPENYLELHYDIIDEQTMAVAQRSSCRCERRTGRSRR